MMIPTADLVQKICTNSAQNYSVITEIVIKETLTLILRRSHTGTVGSTLLPATREQHNQNCTQSH